ncbi:integrase arm-type DNA-binding domain-containing protein [Chelonobacter oris]|uniref:integrase arm-type DNA-binding domain-containing protein n=1 Tax=Chelonobacter oris TaxID=505317 RepID=UPI00244A1956|nr:integrase arm-type DNA-binding domain-containing protein [Chelonobacter oris]
MARIVLNSTILRSRRPRAKDDNKEITRYDGDGLILRFKLSGKKVWYFNYQVPATKKRTKTKLGNYLHLTAMYNEYLSLLANGIDPQVHNEKVANGIKDTTENRSQAIAECGLEMLRRIISRLNEIFRYAVTEELIAFNPADNPAQHFSKPKKQNMLPYRLINCPVSW